MESNDSPEIPDSGETSDIPGLPSGGERERSEREKTERRETEKMTCNNHIKGETERCHFPRREAGDV